MDENELIWTEMDKEMDWDIFAWLRQSVYLCGEKQAEEAENPVKE